MQNDAVNNLRQPIFSSLNSDLQKHAQKDSGELKLKDSPGVGYPTLGRPWVAQGPGAFCWWGAVLTFGRQGSQGKQR